MITGSSHVCFGSKADMCSAQANVRFVPIADIRWPVIHVSASGQTLPNERHIVSASSAAGVSMRQFDVQSAFTGHRTSNVRQVRGADVAGSNRAGRARFGEAHL